MELNDILDSFNGRVVQCVFDMEPGNPGVTIGTVAGRGPSANTVMIRQNSMCSAPIDVSKIKKIKLFEPAFAVLSLVISEENRTWAGLKWEFFDNQLEAQMCADRNKEMTGQISVIEPYDNTKHKNHLGGCIMNTIAKQLLKDLE